MREGGRLTDSDDRVHGRQVLALVGRRAPRDVTELLVRRLVRGMEEVSVVEGFESLEELGEFGALSRLHLSDEKGREGGREGADETVVDFVPAGPERVASTRRRVRVDLSTRGQHPTRRGDERGNGP